MILLQAVASEFAITVADGAVWLAIGQGLLFGAVCLLFGVWVARVVGLLGADAPAGETLGVGLAAGLMVLAAWWAAIWSGGRSSFTPVAIGFAIAIVLALVRRVRAASADDPGSQAEDDPYAAKIRPASHRSLVVTALAGGLFIVAVALLYGSTMAPSVRDGVQPVEATDVAFYAVLGADLASTGTETNISPSGFSDLPGSPTQVWYHWGEIWLASAAITIFGAEPLAARFFIVLPLVLLATAALTGTIVRRMGGTRSRTAFAFGFSICLLLAPIPLVMGPFFSAWASGLIYGATVFGLAAVAVLFAFYLTAVMGTLRSTWAIACFGGSAIALILPAHIVVALLGLIGVAAVGMVRVGRSMLGIRSLPILSTAWRGTALATTIVVASTVAWGAITGHDLGAGVQLAGVSPFNDAWWGSIGVVVLGAGIIWAIPVAWFSHRRASPALADMFLGTVILLIAGAVIWGWRLQTFNMFYFFFAGIAVFATPVAAVALWRLLERTTAHRVLKTGVLALCLIQAELGLVVGLSRLQGHPSPYEPIPVSLLEAIRQLPAESKIAYSCQTFEESSFVNSKLLGIDAYTGRRVVPICFEADVIGPLLGVEASTHVPDAAYAFAPQSALYPDATASPSPESVSHFMEAHGIGYIYADALHPNSLVPDAIPVARSGAFQLLILPWAVPGNVNGN